MDKAFFMKLALGQLRHLLSAFAAVFVSKGYLEASMADAAVGIVVYAGAAVWSGFEKREKK